VGYKIFWSIYKIMKVFDAGCCRACCEELKWEEIVFCASCREQFEKGMPVIDNHWFNRLKKEVLDFVKYSPESVFDKVWEEVQNE
jgi:hypothetical protein